MGVALFVLGGACFVVGGAALANAFTALGEVAGACIVTAGAVFIVGGALSTRLASIEHMMIVATRDREATSGLLSESTAHLRELRKAASKE